MSTTTITGIDLVCVYARDYVESFHFYSDILGLADWTSMGEKACYFKLADGRGIYLVGGFTDIAKDAKLVRTTFCFAVESAFDMYTKMKQAGVEILHEEPVDMGHGNWWFQVYDPSFNIVEFVGGK
jgi:predicted enzyme related to lactoylglutathione lyase